MPAKSAATALRVLVTLLVVSAVRPGAAAGQSNTWVGIAGGVSLPDSGRHVSLAAERTISRRWLAIRAEAVWVRWSGVPGPLAASANAVVPVLRTALTPYAIAGAGVYGIGGVNRETSFNAGAGLRYESRPVRYYAEVRAHPGTRALLSLGIMWGGR